MKRIVSTLITLYWSSTGLDILKDKAPFVSHERTLDSLRGLRGDGSIELDRFKLI